MKRDKDKMRRRERDGGSLGGPTGSTHPPTSLIALSIGQHGCVLHYRAGHQWQPHRAY
jgi:hypothetical protein